MNLNCKDGDLAVITLDEPGLEANIGRQLWVYGPVLEHPELGSVWETVPASTEPMAFLGEDGKLEFDRTHASVIHPDAWMTPVHNTLYPQGRPPRKVSAVPFTREWLDAVESSMPDQVYLSLPRRDAPETPRLSGVQMRARLAASEVCIPIQEDYGAYANWLWFPGRSISATAHWWVNEATPLLIGDVFRPDDQDAFGIYEELENDKTLPWVFADGDWNTFMILPAPFEANLIPRFGRERFEIDEGRMVRRQRPDKNGRLFRSIKDDGRLLESWRKSELLAETSEPEKFLDDLYKALRIRKRTASTPVSA